jgi:hypothetical protein
MKFQKKTLKLHSPHAWLAGATNISGEDVTFHRDTMAPLIQPGGANSWHLTFKNDQVRGNY